MLLLLKLIIIVCGLLLVLLTVSHKKLFKILTHIGYVCRNFIEENTGFFTMFFLILFFIEQVIFISIIAFIFNPSRFLGAFIGVFALVVVTTASLQKFIWQNKYQYATRRTGIIAKKNAVYFKEMKELIDENENLKNILQEKR